MGSNHCCEPEEEKENYIEVKSNQVLIFEEKEDDEKILNYIKENPLEGVLFVKEWCKKNQLKATKIN